MWWHGSYQRSNPQKKWVQAPIKKGQAGFRLALFCCRNPAQRLAIELSRGLRRQLFRKVLLHAIQ